MSPFSRNTKLASLSPAQKDELASWLLDENLSYRDTAERFGKTFGFPVCIGTIMNFWHKECVPRKLLRSAEVARSLQTVATSLQEDWQGVNAQLLGQRIFETLAGPEVDLKAVSALGTVLEKVKTRALHEKSLAARLAAEKRRDKQRERQLAFAREKFEFDAVAAVLKQSGRVKKISTDPALSSDEKREQLRRLLFPQTFEGPPA